MGAPSKRLIFSNKFSPLCLQKDNFLYRVSSGLFNNRISVKSFIKMRDRNPMETITYKKIKNLAVTDYPESRIGIAHLLSAWANHDPGQQLRAMLIETGLSNKTLMEVLTPMVKNPKPDDYKFVSICLAQSQSTTANGKDIMKCLCREPQYRIKMFLSEAGI